MSSRTSRGGPVVSYAGKVHLFRRAGNRWTETLVLQRDTPEELERFGDALSLDGALLAISDAGDDVLGIDTGAVHVYRFDGSSWTKEAELRSPAPPFGLGGALAIDGERILVGGFGRAYVFRHDGGSWVVEATLSGHDTSPRDAFGGAVALDGDLALVGAVWHVHARRDEGAAYVFRRTELGWTEDAELLPDRTSIGASFGCSVDLAVGRALVGASGDDEEAPAAGAAYLYRRDDQGWRLEQKLFPVDETALGFGDHLALGEENALAAGIPTVPRAAVYAFDLCRPARVGFRNAAPNPAVLRCEPPIVGQTFRATVDCAPSGHASAWLFGLDTPDAGAPGRFGVLLARDGGRGELLHAARIPGPLATWESPIPADRSLLGFRCVIQALLIGGPHAALTNAQDLVLGEY